MFTYVKCEPFRISSFIFIIIYICDDCFFFIRRKRLGKIKNTWEVFENLGISCILIMTICDFIL